MLQSERVQDPLDTQTSTTNDGSGMAISTRTRFRPDVLELRRQRLVAFADSDWGNQNGDNTGRKAEPLGEVGLVRYPGTVIETPREIKLQEWEGQVQEVGPVYFSARLVDLTADEDIETEEAELPLDDLTEGDRALLVPGATFRWIIGYRYMQGQKERFARIVIRRLPVWTEKEIIAADKEAADLHNALFGNHDNRATSGSRD